MSAPHRRVVTLCALVLATACGGSEPAEQAPERAAAPGPPLIAPPPQSPLGRTPDRGPPGTEVTLTMSGLLANARDLEIGFGDFTGHSIIGHADADGEGTVATVIAVPTDTPPGTRYFFIAEANGSPLAVSDSFVVTAGGP